MKRSDLHSYQVFSVDYIKSHPESLIILDCGLGKTAVTLTAILDLMFDRFEVGKTLVIAPLRVARLVWPQERLAWDHASFLRMSVMVGDAKQRAAALRLPADVYVINRENVKWLTDYLEKHNMPWPFDMVVIDELSGFKNHECRRWRALRKVRPYIRRIVGLTGTPASNGLLDLWAETFLIDKGERFGRFITRYRETYFKPAGMNPYTGVVYNYVPKPGAEEQIYAKLADISVSMKAKDYLRMPECLTVEHKVEMDPEEKKLYDRMKEEMLLELAASSKDERAEAPQSIVIDAQNAAALSNKLLQMANGAVYTDDREVAPIHTRKLDALEDLIEQANGQSVLIAYWFQHDRDRIQSRFPESRVLQTDRDITDWNAGRIPIALISPASAGHGLNIQQGGHILIWFSMVWSLELYQQTNARLWRQGQKEVVTIHHLVTKDTIDEQVLSALKRKDVTQQNLINAVKAQLQPISILRGAEGARGRSESPRNFSDRKAPLEGGAV